MFTVIESYPGRITNNLTMADFIAGFRFMRSLIKNVKLIWNIDHWNIVNENQVIGYIFKVRIP